MKNAFRYCFFASLIILGICVGLWVQHLKNAKETDELRLKVYEQQLKIDSLETQIIVRDNLINNLHQKKY